MQSCHFIVPRLYCFQPNLMQKQRLQRLGKNEDTGKEGPKYVLQYVQQLILRVSRQLSMCLYVGQLVESLKPAISHILFFTQLKRKYKMNLNCKAREQKRVRKSLGVVSRKGLGNVVFCRLLSQLTLILPLIS